LVAVKKGIFQDFLLLIICGNVLLSSAYIVYSQVIIDFEFKIPFYIGQNRIDCSLRHSEARIKSKMNE